MVLECLYNNFLFDSTMKRTQASLYSRRSCFFGMRDESLEPADDYEGPLYSAWGRWREHMSEEENERCLNPLYYVFGSVDTTEYDNTGATPLTTHINSILTDSGNHTTVDAGNVGLYSTSDRETTPLSTTSSHEVDYYQQGLLIPEVSLCSLRIWDGFFFRYIPQLGVTHEQLQLDVQKLQSRMVRDVQKLKEELNEMELSLGAFTTDLPSCIGEVVLAREREILIERRESVEVGMPLRPRLTASVYSYDNNIDGLGEVFNEREETVVEADDTTPVNSPHNTPTKQQQLQQQQSRNGSISSQGEGTKMAPVIKQTSLAQFTDALYNSEKEDGVLRPKALLEMTTSDSGVGTASARSPVIKTRLRVVKSQTSDPVVAAWQQSSPRSLARQHNKEQQQVTPAERHRDPEITVTTASELTQL